MKVLDRSTDTLHITPATQQLEPGGVDPKHGPVRPDLEQAFQRILQEVTELAVALRQGALHHDPALDFPLQRTRLLLQLRDELRARFRCGPGVALRGYHPPVLRAHALEAVQVHFAGFSRQRISAVEREPLSLPELVPELLELQRRL